ncbi:hypothetical protein [Bacteriovorax sp. Seq25_V]|uniref:hypothetical protein n=1 Tax=Bacteriovorax sp. Seq25_V TaxID=1201288 RepID=UPI00038A35FB|nr:hypothetical protein [Bacteriovorax sp. Seq25_V]EQC44266.1 putative lipoprotein [Bacteriovorax sp. Seq25_V]
MKFSNVLILAGLLSFTSCGMFHKDHHGHKDGKSCSRDGSKKCCDKKSCDRKDKSCHSSSSSDSDKK